MYHTLLWWEGKLIYVPVFIFPFRYSLSFGHKKTHLDNGI